MENLHAEIGPDNLPKDLGGKLEPFSNKVSDFSIF